MSDEEQCPKCGRGPMAQWTSLDAPPGLERWRCVCGAVFTTQELLRNENAQLRAVVEKLPKCWRLNHAGELVKDAPVWPGMPIWVNWHDARAEQMRVYAVDAGDGPGETGALFYDDVVVPLDDAYDSPEALAVAKAAGAAQAKPEPTQGGQP